MRSHPLTVGTVSDATLSIKGTDAPIVTIETRDGVRLPSPVHAKILVPGPKASLLELGLDDGSILPPHRYAQDSIYYVVEGSVRVDIGGNGYDAVARDAWALAAGTEASVVSLGEARILEWMSLPHLVVGSELISWGDVASSRAHVFARWRDSAPFIVHKVEGVSREAETTVDPDHQLRVMIRGPKGALLWNSRTGYYAEHAHGHDSATYVIKGTLLNGGGGSEFLAAAGDVWAVQADAKHFSMGSDDNEIVEFKWPPPLVWAGIIQSWEPRNRP